MVSVSIICSHLTSLPNGKMLHSWFSAVYVVSLLSCSQTTTRKKEQFLPIVWFRNYLLLCWFIGQSRLEFLVSSAKIVSTTRSLTLFYFPWLYQVGTVLLSCSLLYDLFWVFLSKSLFHKSVMIVVSSLFACRVSYFCCLSTFFPVISYHCEVLNIAMEMWSFSLL